MQNESGSRQYPADPVLLSIHDRKIISLLQKNARIPANQIGKEIRLSKAGVGYRIRNLEKRGVIQKYVTHINLLPYGCHYTLAHITHRSTDGEERSFLERLKGEHILFTIYTLSSPRGLMVGIIHDQPLNVNQLEQLASAQLKHAHVEIEGMDSFHLPTLDYAKGKMEIPSHAHTVRQGKKNTVPLTKFALDVRRIQLLSILSKDARISVVELAERTDMHPATVRALMKEMMDNGTILKFSPTLNPHLFGNTFLVAMRGQTPSSEARDKLLGLISSREVSNGVVRLKEKWKFLATLYFPSPGDYFALETEILRDFPGSTFDIQLIREQIELDWFPPSLEKKLLSQKEKSGPARI